MDAAERARIERVKRAVLERRTLPRFARPPRRGVLSRYALVLSSTVALAVLGYLAVLQFPLSPYITVPVFIMNLLLMGVGPVVTIRLLSRIRTSVDALLEPHQGFVCPRCHYPLTGCPDEDQCPECGTLYTRAEVIDLWTRTFNLKHDWPRS